MEDARAERAIKKKKAADEAVMKTRNKKSTTPVRQVATGPESFYNYSNAAYQSDYGQTKPRAAPRSYRPPSTINTQRTQARSRDGRHADDREEKSIINAKILSGVTRSLGMNSFAQGSEPLVESSSSPSEDFRTGTNDTSILDEDSIKLDVDTEDLSESFNRQQASKFRLPKGAVPSVGPPPRPFDQLMDQVRETQDRNRQISEEMTDTKLTTGKSRASRSATGRLGSSARSESDQNTTTYSIRKELWMNPNLANSTGTKSRSPRDPSIPSQALKDLQVSDV